MRAHDSAEQATITPENALRLLREGNYRFLNNLSTNCTPLEQVSETSDGQFPFAVILSCIDSRTPPNLVFDQGLGDLFAIRLAGNVATDSALGSMEFACKLAGSKLIVVLGHSKCGAIKGACDNVQMGNLSILLNGIQPSIYLERTVRENRTSKNPEFVERVARIHVRRSVETVIERSVILREMIERGEVALIGALYDVETGAVEFLDDTLMHGKLKHFYLDVGEAELHEAARA